MSSAWPPVMTTSIAEDGTYLDVNDAMLSRLGYALEDMVGRKPEQFATPETAERIAARLKPSDRPLIQAVAAELKALYGEHVPEDAWDLSALPAHLRMKVRLVDGDGRDVGSGEDLVALKRKHAGSAPAAR